MINPIDAGQIRSVIESSFQPPEYMTLFEVRSQTGFGLRERYADAIIFSMWPSNGLSITGIEIKVSRSDLKHELEQPEKSEMIKRYCDYWWLCLPDYFGYDDFDIPEDWGVMTFSRARRFVKRKPPRLKPIPLSKSFIFACMRAANRSGIDKIERFIRSIR